MKAESLTPSQSSCRVAIRPDGTVVVTDLWQRLGLTGAVPKIASPRTSVVRSSEWSIGLLDHGLLHGEEPAVSGLSGTGAIYVHGCPLRCTTCYQPEFFAPAAPKYARPTEVAELMLGFERAGAHSISIIIATYQQPVHEAMRLAKRRGLSIPIVYKYAGSLAVARLERLRDVVDLFLPDLKAITPTLAARHGLPESYVGSTLAGLRHAMESSTPVIVRHLLVPSFSGLVSEIARMFEALPFASTRTPLSLLTNFYDPERRVIESAPQNVLNQIKILAAAAGVELLIQGRGDYVPRRS